MLPKIISPHGIEGLRIASAQARTLTTNYSDALMKKNLLKFAHDWEMEAQSLEMQKAEKYRAPKSPQEE